MAYRIDKSALVGGLRLAGALVQTLTEDLRS